MKKWFSITMLLIYVFSMTEMHQLLKAPLLVEHYFEHKSENKGMTIISFLELHYLNGNVFDKDYEKDMKLPFKSVQETCYSQVLIIPSSGFEIPAVHSFCLELKSKETIKRSQVFISNYFSSIWQPPKIV